MYPAETEHSTDTEQCANFGDATRAADPQNDKKDHLIGTTAAGS